MSTEQKDVQEIIEEITDALEWAGRSQHGGVWDSALVEGADGERYHAVTSQLSEDVVFRTGGDERENSWLCDYLEAVSPENIGTLLSSLKEKATAAPARYDFDAPALKIAQKIMECTLTAFEDGWPDVRLKAAIQCLVIEAMKWVAPAPIAFIDGNISDETMQQLMKELSRTDGIITAPAARECLWTWDEHDYHWQAGCGGTWLFTDGGPEENEVKFCQCCGGKVVINDEPAPGGDDA